MRDWGEEKFNMLVSSATLRAAALMNKKRGALADNERAKIFASLLTRGKIKEAMRFAREREKGGVLLPDDIEEKSGSFAKDALKSKHPHARDADLGDIPEFPECPEFQGIAVDADIVEIVAKKLSDSHGPTGAGASTMAI